MMRALGSFGVAVWSAVTLSAVQASAPNLDYLTWSALDAERVGKSTRVNGRVGGALDFRVVHTEHSYNYKLRATWLSRDVVCATARLLQLSDHLSDEQTE